MKLAEVASGAVYVDTNVLYMYLRGDPGYLPEIRVFLSRVIRGEIEVFVGLPVLDVGYIFVRLMVGYRLLIDSLSGAEREQD